MLVHLNIPIQLLCIPIPLLSILVYWWISVCSLHDHICSWPHVQLLLVSVLFTPHHLHTLLGVLLFRSHYPYFLCLAPIYSFIGITGCDHWISDFGNQHNWSWKDNFLNHIMLIYLSYDIIDVQFFWGSNLAHQFHMSNLNIQRSW